MTETRYATVCDYLTAQLDKARMQRDRERYDVITWYSDLERPEAWNAYRNMIQSADDMSTFEAFQHESR